MRRLLFKLLLFVICVISLSSCATMTRWSDSSEKNKRMYTVRIESKTPHLPVYYTEKGVDHFVGVTPCNVYSDKARIQYVTVRNGDEYQTVKLKTKLRNSTYWNIVPAYTWIWGFFVDRSTRRSVIYGQKEYYVDL